MPLKGVVYRENLQTKTCVKSALKGPFRPIGVPPTAQFRGYVYIGSSQNEHSGIKVQQWYNQSDTGVSVWQRGHLCYSQT